MGQSGNGHRPQGIGTLGRVHITLAVLGVALFGFGIGNATGGKLVAVGTTSDHVVITSLASEQNQGDWVGIEVWPEGAAQFRYADISYAGSYGTSGGDLIVVNANSLATLDVDHSSFTYSLGYGIYLSHNVGPGLSGSNCPEH